MNFQMPLFSAVNSEIILLVAACIALLADLFQGDRYKQIAYVVCQCGLVLASLVSVFSLWSATSVTFNGLFVGDVMSHILKIFIYLITACTFLYSTSYNEQRQLPRAEVYILGMFSALGMSVLVSGHSLLSIYLGLELLSLPLYAMVALRRDDRQATEASMKYFIMGAIASGILLYGMSMIYGATGSLEIDQIAAAINAIPTTQHWVLTFGTVFVVAGIGFKFASVPFHMWAPDVYTGAPTSITLFLSTAPKLAAFGMAIRLLTQALPGLQPQWQQILIVMSVFSMVIGNLVAIAQVNIKRMLAYSAIAHVGYLFLGLIAGTKQGYSASLFYILCYAPMSLAAFGGLMMLNRAGYEAQTIEDFRGLNSRDPWLAFLMMVTMFSMAGVPPTAGFLAKLLVLKSVVDVGFIWLAAIALGCAIVGVFYYIRIIKVMYFDTQDELQPLEYTREMSLVISANGLFLLFFGLFPTVLLRVCQLAFS